MKFLAITLLAITAGSVASTYFKNGGSFPGDCEERQKNRDCLLDGGDKSIDSSDDSNEAKTTTQVSVTSSTYGQCTCSCEHSGNDDDLSSGIEDHSSGDDDHEGSGGHGEFEYDDYCLLFQYFYNISIEITDVTIREAWLELIYELQITIIYDKSLTYDEKLVAIWTRIEAFVSIHVEIRELVYYTYIAEWNGYICDIRTAVVFIQYQYTATIIELDFSGSCILFEALRNCSGVDAEYSARIEILIKELTVILQTTTYSYSYQLVLVYQKIQAFFVQYSQYKAAVFEVEIEGYGSFYSFYQVSLTYWQIYNFDVAIGGSSSECGVIKGLTELYQNTSTGSKSQRAQIKQLVDKCVTYFDANVEAEVRVAYFVEQLYEFLIVQEWSYQLIVSLEIEGFGFFSELIVAYGFSKNCGCVDFSTPTTIAGGDSTDSGFSTDYTESYTQIVTQV